MPRPRSFVVRLLLACVVLVVGVAALPAQAGTPVVDGKRVTHLDWTAQSGVNTPSEQDIYYGVNSSTCRPPRCDRHPFVWQPAKGVTGNILFATKWTFPGEDYDLSLVNSRGAGIVSCYGTGGTGEAIVVPASKLVPGQTYTVVTSFTTSVPDTMHNTLEFPTQATQTQTPLDLIGFGCTLDGTIR